MAVGSIIVLVAFAARMESVVDSGARGDDAARNSDGWVCDGSFGVHPSMGSEACQDDARTMFPCEPQAGNGLVAACFGAALEVGRVCRCDGCIRLGGCMLWDYSGPTGDRMLTGTDPDAACGSLMANAGILGGTKGVNGDTSAPHRALQKRRMSEEDIDPSIQCHCNGVVVVNNQFVHNHLNCTNGETRYCASDQDCFTDDPFAYGNWSAGCRDKTPPSPPPDTGGNIADSVPDYPQWRQLAPDDHDTARNSGAVMWVDEPNGALYLYLFVAGVTCPPEYIAQDGELQTQADKPDSLKDKTIPTIDWNTIGGCPIEGQTRLSSCGGEANTAMGDLCTGGLYRYGLEDRTWKHTNTNKDLQVSKMFQSEYVGPMLPTARNDPLQWSERVLGGSGVFIFGGVGCDGTPFEATATCMPHTLMDLWWFDIVLGWYFLGDQGNHVSAGNDGSASLWPQWRKERATWSSSSSAKAGTSGPGTRKHLWMFGGIPMITSAPEGDLWCYTFTTGVNDQPTAGTWMNLHGVGEMLESGASARGTVQSMPPARYGATAWSNEVGAGTVGAVAYLFGGISWPGVTAKGYPAGYHQDGMGQQLGFAKVPCNVSAHQYGPCPPTKLSDLWSFNGDIDNPAFEAHTPDPAFGEYSWPPAGTGDGWSSRTAAGRQGGGRMAGGVPREKLWLWTPPEKAAAENFGTLSAPPPEKPPSNQLWAFSIELNQWERVPTGDDSTVWPGARDTAMISDGFIFGGVGTAECDQSDAGFATRSLVGLWQLTPQDDVSQDAPQK